MQRITSRFSVFHNSIRMSLTLDSSESDETLLQLVRMLHQQLMLAVISNFLVAAGALWFFSHVLPVRLLIIWGAGILIFNLLRVYVIRGTLDPGFKASTVHTRARQYIAITTLLGICWGTFTFMPFAGNDLYRLMSVLMLTGMAGGALTSNAALVVAYYGFVFPILVPMSAFWLFIGGELGVIIGVMTSVYGIYLIITAWKLHTSYSESIALRLRQEHMNQELQATEKELDAELRERRRVEADLYKVKSRLEEAVGRLELLSSVDSLTGIANRRIFDEGIKREWGRARRDKTALSLLLVDVDYFKNYNDAYMHQAGDEALKIIANVIASHANRPGDMAARYGGEEFALILSDCDRPGAMQIAQRLCHEVHAMAIPHEHSKCNDVITVSIGVMAINAPESDDYSDLITNADQALYEAKAAGRNQVKAAWTL